MNRRTRQRPQPLPLQAQQHLSHVPDRAVQLSILWTWRPLGRSSRGEAPALQHAGNFLLQDGRCIHHGGTRSQLVLRRRLMALQS